MITCIPGTDCLAHNISELSAWLVENDCYVIFNIIFIIISIITIIYILKNA